MPGALKRLIGAMGGSNHDAMDGSTPKKRRSTNTDDRLDSTSKNGNNLNCTSISVGVLTDPNEFAVSEHRNKRHFTVDLDAAENSDSEYSTRSFSTSGVSSLLPRSWAMGPKVMLGNENPCYLHDNCISSPVVEISHEESCSIPKDFSHRFPKRQRIFDTDSVQDSLTSKRRKPTYGGAASSRSIRDIFKPANTLKYDLQLSGNTQCGRNSATENLSSTAQRILNTLEQFTTPLSVLDKAPFYMRSSNSSVFKQLLTPKFTSQTFSPYTSIYKESQKLPNEMTSISQNEVSRLPAFSNSNNLSPGVKNINGKCDVQSTKGETFIVTTTNMCVCSSEPSTMGYTFASPLHVFPSVIPNCTNVGNLITEFTFSVPKRMSHEYVPEFSVYLPDNSSNSDISKAIPCLDKALSEDKWRCETCLLENTTNKNVCSGCSTPKLQAVLSTVVHHSEDVHKGDKLSNIAGFKSAEKWECPSCLVNNEKSVDLCVCCRTHNPNSANQSSLINSTGVFTSKSSDCRKWECSNCLVSNNDNSVACVCCKTPKPNASNKNISVSFKSSATKKWECPICMVSNEFNVNLCACCKTPKQGLLITTTQSNVSNFTFGQSTKPLESPVLSNIKFGLTQSSLVVSSTNTSALNSNSSTLCTKAATISFGKPINFQSGLKTNQLTNVSFATSLSQPNPLFSPVITLSNNSSSNTILNPVFGFSSNCNASLINRDVSSTVFGNKVLIQSSTSPVSSVFGSCFSTSNPINKPENNQIPNSVLSVFSTQDQNNNFSTEDSVPRRKIHAARRLRR